MNYIIRILAVAAIIGISVGMGPFKQQGPRVGIIMSTAQDSVAYFARFRMIGE